MPPPSAPLLLIGLDAAEPSLLRTWAGDGTLPTLRRLIDTGHAGDLASPAAQFPDSVWPVLYTSHSPGRITPYFFIQPDPRRARLRLVDHELSGAEPFWAHAARQGQHCAVLDAPKIGPLPPRDGVQLVNWGAHATTATPSSTPVALVAHLRATYGPYPLRTCDDHGTSAAEYARIRRALLEAVALRRRMLLDLLRSRRWDCFFTVFSELHCAGHQLWHLHDRSHPDHPRDGGDGNALRDVYQAVDAAIGELVAAAGPQARIMVCSAHGMQPEYHGRDLLPALLAWWGLRGAHDVPPDAARERTSHVRQPLLTRVRKTLPLRWQYAVKYRLPRALERELVCRFVGALRLDVGARVFCVPNNDLTPAFRINLIGRDPFGRVAPADYAAVRALLITRLRELVNPATGRPALREVSCIAERYDGPYADELPDVVGYFDTARPIEALYSPGYGTLTGTHGDMRTGGHRERGFLVVSAAAGARGAPLANGDIRDVAPTALHLLGVDVPPDMEGTPLLRDGVGAALRRTG